MLEIEEMLISDIFLTALPSFLPMGAAQGGRGFPSPFGISCGSSTYWILTLGSISWAGGFFLWVRQYLLLDCEAKVILKNESRVWAVVVRRARVGDRRKRTRG